MDCHDLKAREIENFVGHPCSPKKPSLLGKKNGLSDFHERSVDASVGVRKHGYEHNQENVSPSKKISMKSDVSSDSGQSIDKNLQAGTNGYWLNTSGIGLKSGMHATFPDKQCKTESSSSNSSHIILPASSNDSYQETSLDFQSCKLSKINAMDSSTYTNLKSNLEEPAIGSLPPGMALRNPEDKLKNIGKQCNLFEVSKILDNDRTRSSDNVTGMGVENKFASMEHSDMLKKENKKVVIHDKTKLLCKLEDLVDVAPTVIKEVYQEFEASGSSTSVEGRNNEMVRISSVDSRIDLNEDVPEHGLEFLKQSGKETICNAVGSVSKPKPVVAKFGIPINLPAPQVRKEWELGGWRGSTTSSAFKPTSVGKNCLEKNKVSSVNDENDGKKHSCIKHIDLNIAAIGADFDVELIQDNSLAESSLEAGSIQAKKLDFDLNCVSGIEDCQQSSLTTSLSRNSVRDFDLNDNPTSMDTCSFYQTGQGTESLRNRGSDSPPVSSLENPKQPDLGSFKSACYRDLSSTPGFVTGRIQPFLVAPPGMLPSNEELQRIAFLQPQLAYAQPPPHVFRVDPKYSLSSTAGTHGVLPYMVDPHSTTILSQVLGSNGLPAFPSGPNVFQVPHGSGPSNITMTRSNMDVYNGVNVLENVNRGANAGQLFIPSSHSTKSEELMKNSQQVVVSASSMKRKEPEGEWNSPQLCFRQRTHWR